MKINKDCEKPIYLQLKDGIISEIKNGSLIPGSKVDSEKELSDKYGISRVTAQKAYGELVDEGYLVRKRGKGTFVRDVQYYMNLGNSRSFTITCKELGITPSTKVIKTDIVKADEKVAEALGIDPGIDVAYAERLRFADGVPVRLEYNYYAPVYIDVIKEDLSQSVSKLFEAKYGVSSTRENRYRITIEYSSPYESSVLSLKNSTPILSVSGTMYDHRNEPMYFTEMKHIPDRCILML